MPEAQTTKSLDQFDMYNELVRRARRSAYFSAGLLVITLLAVALAFLSFTRPLPVVVTSDDPLEPRRIIAAGDTHVREIDAKRFMGAMARRLHGWSSATVVGDLTEASTLMTAKWRKRFAAEVNADVKVPEGIEPNGHASVLQSYVLAKVRNELTLDWESALCAKDAGSATWHCKANATMRIAPLLGEPGDDPKLEKRMTIRATFVEVAPTSRTIDGLLVDFWDASVEARDPL